MRVMPDDTDMTPAQFLATRQTGLPVKVVTSRGAFLRATGNGGAPAASWSFPGVPVTNPLDEVRSAQTVGQEPLAAAR